MERNTIGHNVFIDFNDLIAVDGVLNWKETLLYIMFPAFSMVQAYGLEVLKWKETLLYIMFPAFSMLQAYGLEVLKWKETLLYIMFLFIFNAS